MNQIMQLAVDENKIAFQPMMGNSYQLNGIGRDIINLIKENKDKYEIVDILVEQYEKNYNDVFIDVNDFFAKLKIYGLI